MKSTIKKAEPLLKAPSFSSQEARDLGISAALLSYYVKIGSIERLGRGIYRGIGALSVPDFRIEDFKHTVICLLYAL